MIILRVTMVTKAERAMNTPARAKVLTALYAGEVKMPARPLTK